MNDLILALGLIGLIIGGWLVGFGMRGAIEYELNKNLKGYRSFWKRKHDALVSGEEK